VRLASELFGVAFYLAAHVPLVLVYALGSTLRGVMPIPYWGAIGGGYLALMLAAALRPGPLGRVPARRALDTFLLTAGPALILSAAAVWARWPLQFERWDGHGMGASGGEANAAFVPWLHGVLWLVAAARPGNGDRDGKLRRT
jgi:hypothetical protein